MARDEAPSGKVWLVGAGPGDPDLITCRGADVLGKADVVFHDALSHPELLLLCTQAEIFDVGKQYGQRATPQAVITAKLIEAARSGARVVRLKGGDPLMFARGSEEALALAEAGIPFELVPGITSPMAASMFAGIPLTHRELSSSVTFITGSDREGVAWSPDAWNKLATATGTICVLMGMRRIDEITRAIMDGGRDPATPAAVVHWGARPEQRTAIGRLDTIAAVSRQQGLGNPAIIIVGDVVSVRPQMNWYETRPLFGRRILVPRPQAQARATAEAIRARAATPVVAPAIAIDPSPDPAALWDAAARASDYDWVIFTSANGVESFFEALARVGRDARSFGEARVAVIGPRTGAAIERRGIVPDLTATQFVAESLVEDLLAQEPPLRKVLIPRAKEARDILPESLRAAGAEVDVVAAYVTRPVEGAERERLIAAVGSEVDVVLFTSSSMVSAVVDALGEEAPAALARLTVVCIGPITAKTARAAGISIDVEADVHTVEGALDALEAHLTRTKLG